MGKSVTSTVIASADATSEPALPADSPQGQGHSFRQMLATLRQRGRLSDHAPQPAPPPSRSSVNRLDMLCQQLLSRRGEASGTALARTILTHYQALSPADRLAFFHRLATHFDPDPDRLARAWMAHSEHHSPATLRELSRAIEAPRQELLRRLNQAPGGTRALVAMRADLLAARDPALASVDDDFVHLLTSWFNRGFLLIERISWSSPADLLERIIRYEAVHTIQGWDDLRGRLQPPDRRCYAFFHPALADEPLIFVEVALTREIPGSIQQILAPDRAEIAAHQANTAVFYSISNCQEGLRGISFGNLLIKQVVEELKRDLPRLKTFVTLSPVPGFMRWLKDRPEQQLALLDQPNWHRDYAHVVALQPLIMKLAPLYFLEAKNKSGQPLDPVARFHLGNGARLEQINWLGDTSAKGLREGAGLMVNYLYDLRTIERNHEAYWNSGTVCASPAITRQQKSSQRR